MNALELRGLRKNFEGVSLDTGSLHKYREGFSLYIGQLSLPQGCVMGLVGENGAGKTTLLRLILGILRPDAGTVTLGDLTKDDIGVVLDEVGIPSLTARQTGNVLGRIYRRWDAALYARTLDRLAVPMDKPFDKLSRGMKMKLGIAAALSHGPKLLLLDEATNGLDPVARDEVLDILWEFTRAEDHSILISSHIVSDLEKICDSVAFLHKGRLLLCEEKDALTSEYGLLRCPAARLDELDADAVLARRDGSFGAEAVVRKSGVPAGTELFPVGVEDIFVAMIRGGRT